MRAFKEIPSTRRELTRVTCDCCGVDITDNFNFCETSYHIVIRENTRIPDEGYYDEELDYCEDCFDKIKEVIRNFKLG